MAVSVIISNFNGAKYLPRLLETLAAQRGVDLQIIVVDRNSTDESHQILAGHPNVLVVSEPPESGLVSGYDTGARHAVHPHLFFCNEDMWFDADCLAQLEKSLDTKAGVWAADPWQWTYDGATWIHGGTRFQKVPRYIANIPHPFRDMKFCVPLKHGETVAFGCAGAILVDRDAYRQLGGWDRGFFLDREDIDLFLRAWRADLKCVCVPTAKVYHAVNVSNAKSINGGTLPVGKRRFISGCSSQLITSVKYFPLRWIVFHVLAYLLWSLTHLARLRLKQFGWEMLALREFARRLPGAWNYRSQNRDLLRRRPGQTFFTEPAFQVPGGLAQS